jgi:hypothetical protein
VSTDPTAPLIGLAAALPILGGLLAVLVVALWRVAHGRWWPFGRRRY